MEAMAKEAALARVEADLRSGDVGKARDRLHTLVHDYPNDVGLRTRLAEVYQRLKFPAMAGRYWYLEASWTAEMEDSIAIFRRSCGDDPLRILSALKFRGDSSQIPKYARERLGSLQQAVHGKYGFSAEPNTPSRMLRRRRGEMLRAATYGQESIRHPSSRGFVTFGRNRVHRWAALAGAVIIALAATGLVSIARWLWGILG